MQFPGLSESDALASTHISSAILPLVVTDNDRAHFRTVGTCTVVHPLGLALTASHVLAEIESLREGLRRSGGRQLEVSAMFNSQLFGFARLPVREWKPVVGDIAVCTLGLRQDMDQIPYLDYEIRDLIADERITCFGSVFVQTTDDEDPVVVEGAGRLSWSNGSVLEVLPDGREPAMPFPVALVDAAIEPGMSGGPVVDGRGLVVGINVRGASGDVDPYGYVMSLKEAGGFLAANEPEVSPRGR